MINKGPIGVCNSCVHGGVCKWENMMCKIKTIFDECRDDRIKVGDEVKSPITANFTCEAYRSAVKAAPVISTPTFTHLK